MMKRLSLLLAALFVAATMFAAPVIASGIYQTRGR